MSNLWLLPNKIPLRNRLLDIYLKHKCGEAALPASDFNELLHSQVRSQILSAPNIRFKKNITK